MGSVQDALSELSLISNTKADTKVGGLLSGAGTGAEEDPASAMDALLELCLVYAFKVCILPEPSGGHRLKSMRYSHSSTFLSPCTHSAMSMYAFQLV